MGFEGVDFIGILFKTHFVVLLAGIVILIFISENLKPFVAATSVILIAISTSLLAAKGITNGFEFNFNAGSFIGIIPFRIDALSAWFILIINLISTTGILYGIGYLQTYKSQRSINTIHWATFIIFQCSMI